MRFGILLLALAATTQAQNTSWRDVESRVQYAYYTEDAAALRGLQGTLTAADSDDPLKRYYAGLLAWRQAQLALRDAAAAGGASAMQHAQRCVGELDAALAVRADFADALALRAL
ncbi:MAG: hypothetical protein JOZ89_10405, partial [Gammaproteobacteria bacterium]|nr:hypothetical protein [Gammaproteobacteria bacterium]